MSKKYQKNNNTETFGYLGKAFNVTHIILLVTSILAFLVLVVVLTIILIDPYQKIYFDSTPIVYVFFALIILLMVVLSAMAIINFAGGNLMPTYDEFKRAQDHFAYLKNKSRFPELLDFDYHHAPFTQIQDDYSNSLQSICDDFSDYMAAELGLYYEKKDIRKFISSIAVSKTMILQGMSGTGKTSIAVAFGKFLGVPSTVVPVQPMWKEKSDLLGYYNEFTGKFSETTILKKIYEANFSNKIFIIVLDELNIARVEYYFSEFLSLLELPASSERKLSIASNGEEGDPMKMDRGRILLPDNVWFLGTANNDDSTFAVSDKVYDRAMVLNLNKKADRFVPERNMSSVNLSVDRLKELTENAMQNNPLSGEMIAKINKFDEYLFNEIHVTFGNRIMTQIKKYVPVYVACGGTENEGVDGLICTKILRKLESKNPIFVKTKSQELISKIEDIFGVDEMNESINFITNLVNNI